MRPGPLTPVAASIALAACLSAPASARDVFFPHLTWNTCPNEGGVSDIVMPCGAGGTAIVIGTFELNEVIPPPFPEDHLILSFSIDIETSEATLPGFWRLWASAPGCPSHLSSYCSNDLCGVSPFLGPCTLQVELTPLPGNPLNHIRVEGITYDSVAGPDQTLVRGTEYQLFELLLNLNAAAESGGACDGCCAPVAISLSIWNERYQFTSFPNPPLTANANGSICSVTPAQATTWGLLKSLYR